MILKSIFIFYFFLFLSFNLTAQIQGYNAIIAKDALLEKFGGGFSFTEGPATDEEGNVYFTDQPNNKIHRWDAKTGKITVFSDNTGRSNGLYFDQEGNLIACADMDNQLWSFDTQGNSQLLLENFEGKLLNGPNDLWVHPNGGIYFTDPLYKRGYWKRNPQMQQNGEFVYFFNPENNLFICVDETLEKPNGIIGTPDGKKLYVADIGADKTYVFEIGKDQRLINKSLFVNQGSDGMTIDDKGNIYLTGKGVTVYDKNGKKIAHIPVNAGWTANVTFGGTNNNILFITAMDAVYGLKMNVKGTK